MEYRCPILLIDDEYADISDLEQVLRHAAIKAGHPEGITVHCESCEEAVDFMKQQKKTKKGISAIVCDNHIGTSEIDGDDFLRLIRGNALYCYSGFPEDAYVTADHFRSIECLQKYSGKRNPQITRFLQENFKDFDQYLDLYKYYYPEKGTPVPTIMLCGHPREVNPEGLGGVHIFGKDIRERNSKTPCELDVLQTLTDLGLMALDEIDYGIKRNGRLSHPDPKKRAYNPCANTIRKQIRERRSKNN